jgi:hypothetical protein
MTAPRPTPVFRLVHVDSLDTILRRGRMHGTNHVPDDGLPYRTIHSAEIQAIRHDRPVRCGPGGTMHDYVPFYFGYLSPMLLQLKTGRVSGYSEGQTPLLYLVSTIEDIAAAGCQFVFTDGHGIATFTQWFDDLSFLDRVDWSMVYERYWTDSVNDMDRQRRKQAEFLVYQTCPWSVIREVAVPDSDAKTRVETILRRFPPMVQRPVHIRPEWYYY